MNTKLHVLIFILMATFGANAQITPDANNIIYVDKDVSGSNGTGSSWGNAVTTLQPAIDASTAGVKIFVKKGEYLLSASIVMKEGVKIYGSFAGFETSLAARDITNFTNDVSHATILNGNNSRRVIINNFTSTTAMTTASVLDGFVITNGRDNDGGGIYNSYASPTLTNLIITNNKTNNGGNGPIPGTGHGGNGGNGAGMYNNSSSPVLTNVVISNNTTGNGGNGGSIGNGGNGGSGGGMFNNSSSPSLTNVTISNNTTGSGGSVSFHTSVRGVGGNGGGVFNNSSSFIMYNVTISDNTSIGNGGGVFNSSSSPTMTFVTISGNSGNDGGGIQNVNASSPILKYVNINNNTAVNSGGGVSNHGSSPELTLVIIQNNTANNGGGMLNQVSASPILTNVTISKNTANSSGGGVSNHDSSPSIYNTIVVGNNASNNTKGIYNNPNATPDIQYSLIEGSEDISNNNLYGFCITASDLFVDIDNNNFALKNSAVVANKGSNALYTSTGNNINTDFDPALNPRLYNSIIDMGAYELQENHAPIIFPDVNNILYVDVAASGNGSGSSWENALTDLNTALCNATPNLKIFVKKGEYTISTAFRMREGIKIYGSFSGTETTLAERNLSGFSNNASNATVLNANNTGIRVIENLYTSGSPMTTASVLDGFVVTGGRANEGGGIYNLYASPTFSNLIITNNKTNGGGNGQTFENGGNGGNGAGMYNHTSSPVLTQVLVSKNTTGNGGNGGNFGDGGNGGSGAGIFNYLSSPVFTNVTISNNNTGNGGGPGTFGNYGGRGNGGGIYNASSSLEIYNSIILGNDSGNFDDGSSASIIQYSLVQGLAEDEANSNLNGTCAVVANVFTDADNDDFSLKNTAIAVNVGNNTLYSNTGGDINTDKDLAGNVRLYDGTPAVDVIDMGAYELQEDLVPIAPDANNILYVNKNAICGGIGDSWESALPELADALKYAKQQDNYTTANPLQIFVAAGTYKPLYSPEDGVNFGTDQGRNNSFLMVNNVQLYGGFDPSNGISTLAHERILPQFDGSGTILSGDIGTENDTTDNAYNVFISSGEVGIAILDGFAIIDGYANSYSDITINSNQVFKCSGSGIYNAVSSPSYNNVALHNNSCTESGGGMFSYMSSPNLQYVVFKNNQAKDGGGMANQEQSSPTLLNVSIESNIASENGSGMYNVDQSSPVLTNVSIVGNEASINSAEVPSCVSENSDITFNNSIVWDVISGDYIAQNSLIQGNSDTSNNNIDATGLVDTDIFTDPANGNFTLQASSPVINLGSNTAYTNAGGDLQNDVDLAGNPRVYVGIPDPDVIDMGAYEFQGEPVLPTAYFITTWQTTTDSESITIPTFSGETYNYTVNWGDGNSDTGIIGNATHTFATAGTYTVKINGTFPRIYFENGSSELRIKSVEQWGTNVWSSMNSAFLGCENLVGNASDTPNLSLVNDMSSMFEGASAFNQDIGNWNVSNVTDMNGMFEGASAFNQNIDSWDVGNVTDMSSMFMGVTLSTANYDALLNGWNSLTLQNGVTFDGGNSTYCAGQIARANMVSTFGWTITDGGRECTDFCGDVTEYTTAGGWSNGMPDSNKKAVFADNYNTALGSIDACSIEINIGVTVTVSEGTTIRAEYYIDINGDLIFLSSATGNGELAAMGSSATITGNALVQRYMQNKRSYRMVTSAATTATSIHDNWQEGATSNADNPATGFGTHITGTTTDQMNGFDGTITGNVSMFTINIANQQFQAIDNTDINTLIAGYPYLLFVRGDRSTDLSNDLAAGETILRANGALATGTNTQNFATTTAGEFVMFGNPYQSAVDLNSAFAGSTNLNTSFYYMYDSSLGDHGAYVTVSLPSGTNTASSAANQYLQPGQAAQIATMANGASAVTFNESDKAPGNFTATNRPMSGNDMLTVQLYTTENYNNEGPVHDSFGIVFTEGNNNGITLVDAVKPMNFYENLGVNNNGTYLSIEQREMPQPAEVYSLYSTGYQQSEYTLKIIVDGLDANFFYLDDNFTNTSTILEAGENSYGFTVDANNPLSIATDRFSIHSEQRLGVDDNNLLSGIRLYPNPMANQVSLGNPNNVTLEHASIYDITGRLIKTVDLSGATSETVIDVSTLSSATYLVVINGENGQVSQLMVKE